MSDEEKIVEHIQDKNTQKNKTAENGRQENKQINCFVWGTTSFIGSISERISTYKDKG